MPGMRSYGKRMGFRSRRITKPRASERTKLLEEGIKLKRRLDDKRGNLSNKDMEAALAYSRKVDKFSGDMRCSSCGGKVTPEQIAWREKAHPGERMLCTGCAIAS
jgi:hypothetical protein